MDALRFASTKIQPPRLRSARIARPRLEARLREALQQRRVVLLLAPAGFGKTCALAALFDPDGSNEPSKQDALAWVSLDEDDDPQRLFACLIAALEPFDLPWRAAPEALIAQLADGEAAARRAIAELVNALAATDVTHGVILLDDLHRVQTPAVHTLLDALIERLPAQWTLVISTRVEPPLAFARLRVADELAEFGQHDLRFDADEAGALAAGHLAGQDDRGATPMADAAIERRVAELFERTQGWPAGLRLCLAALRSRPGGHASGLAAGASTARVDHHLFDYLAGEVLDDMPAELHDFLLRCSVLPALTDVRCAAVSGDPRAADRLDEVERRGLFVTALDAHERTLVLHDLFREALDERLRRRLPDELPQLLKRAAAGEEDPLRRVGFLLRAGEFGAAEGVLADASEQLLLEGGVGELRRAIEQFSVHRHAGSPRLHRVHATCLAHEGQWVEMVGACEAAIAGARASGDETERQLAQAYLAAALRNAGRHEACAAQLDDLRPQALSDTARAVFLSTECSVLVYAGGQGRLPAAFAEQLDAMERGGSLFVWWMCAPSSSWASIRGMRALLERYCRGALQRVGERELMMRADAHLLHAYTLLWAGRFDEALAGAALARSDLHWLASWATRGANMRVFQALVDAMSGRVEPAEQMLEDWLAQLAGMAAETARHWRHDIAMFAIRVLDAAGSAPQRLERWGRLFADGLPDMARFEDDAPRTAAYLARIAAAEGRWPDAAALFQRLLPIAAGRMESFGQVNELHLRAAHALLQCGRLDAAAAALAPALQRIRSEGERGHAMMAGSQVLVPLAQARWGARLEAPLREELEALAGLAVSLRELDGPRSLAAEEAAASTLREARGPVPAVTSDAQLSTREREVLERIAAGDSNKVIARVLDISPHTVKRHVANILDKLGLASRGQAAAWVHGHA
ncbi:MAG TPA: LuxR C-terminal-related transcriptional regulator [Burkholderiaceae bacterium]|nr:LuxR C-terminal-related transcriptional regulator [Burkholderiaceae bacterium]